MFEFQVYKCSLIFFLFRTLSNHDLSTFFQMYSRVFTKIIRLGLNHAIDYDLIYDEKKNRLFVDC